NVDDVFVLLGFFSDPKFKAQQVVWGQYVGIGTLYVASVVASSIALAVAPAYVGLLGLVPIVIGLKKVSELRRGAEASEEELEDHAKASTGHGNIVAVAAVTMANGADNISIYTPLFAPRSGYDIAVLGVVFAIMTMAWIVAAHWLTHHRAIGAPIRRYGHRVVPFVLIALGVLILHDADTVEMFLK
ncbi:cadmium resistance transporter, partial [Rudaea sp.]|uniref:cadmium resistance transporter n=1 Tax=Rudaea sp. TaxID=2136325 RepID=UPI00321FE7C3